VALLVTFGVQMKKGSDKPAEAFYTEFAGRFSAGFDVTQHLQRIGVVNQTTQLATDTQAIAEFLKQTIQTHYGLTASTIEERFADTRDTLCYATNDNQTAVTGMLQTPADIAIVVGGYNSSNTTHLAELCEQQLPTYFINSEEKLLSSKNILHYNYHNKEELVAVDYLPTGNPARILITSRGSCPGAVVEGVIRKLSSFYGVEQQLDAITNQLAG
jgi:4-hydroxy-3-methylbut-2-enyl diphosphate reductase